MARSFAGGTSTDKIVTAINSTDASISVSAWIYKTGTGGGTFGRVVSKPNSTTASAVEDKTLYIGGGTNQAIRYEQRFGTAMAVWDCPWNAATLDNSWHHIALTYNHSATTNTPRVFIDGVEQTVTLRTAGTGTVSNNVTFWHIGNRSDNIRAFQGAIAELGIWARLLDPSEIAMLARGLSPLYFIGGTRIIHPLLNNGRENLRGGGSTLTGTTAFTHPPIVYPDRITSFYGVTVAPIPTSTANPSSLALVLSLGSVSALSTALIRPGNIALPLSLGGVSTLTTANVLPAPIPLPLSISAASSRANASPASLPLPISLGSAAIRETRSATVDSLSLPIVLGSVNTNAIRDTYFIDCGSATDYTDSRGKAWQADTKFEGGSVGSSSVPVAGSDDALYQTYRTGDFRYDFQVPSGKYRVSAYFNELTWTGGENQTAVETFYANDINGFIGIGFILGAGDPGLSAIRVEPASVPVESYPDSLPITLSLGAVVVRTQANVASLQVPLTLAPVSTNTAAIARPASISLPLTVSSVSTRVQARPASIPLSLSLGSVSTQSDGALTVPSLSLPLSLGGVSIITTARVLPSTLPISLSLGTITSKSTANLQPSSILFPISLGAIATKTTAKVNVSGLALTIMLGSIDAKGVGVIPISYGGKTSVRLRNRTIDVVKTGTGRTDVKNLGKFTDVVKPSVKTDVRKP